MRSRSVILPIPNQKLSFRIKRTIDKRTKMGKTERLPSHLTRIVISLSPLSRTPTVTFFNKKTAFVGAFLQKLIIGLQNLLGLKRSCLPIRNDKKLRLLSRQNDSTN